MKTSIVKLLFCVDYELYSSVNIKLKSLSYLQKLYILYFKVVLNCLVPVLFVFELQKTKKNPQKYMCKHSVTHPFEPSRIL